MESPIEFSVKIESLKRQEEEINNQIIHHELAELILADDEEFRKVVKETKEEDLMKQINILQKTCKNHVRYDQQTYEKFLKERKKSDRLDLFLKILIHGATGTAMFFVSPVATAGYLCAMLGAEGKNRAHRKLENNDKIVLGRLLEMEHHFLQRFNPDKKFRTALQFDPSSEPLGKPTGFVSSANQNGERAAEDLFAQIQPMRVSDLAEKADSKHTLPPRKPKPF